MVDLYRICKVTRINSNKATLFPDFNTFQNKVNEGAGQYEFINFGTIILHKSLSNGVKICNNFFRYDLDQQPAELS